MFKGTSFIVFSSVKGASFLFFSEMINYLIMVCAHVYVYIGSNDFFRVLDSNTGQLLQPS